MAEFLVGKILDQLADEVFGQLRKEFKMVTGVKKQVESLSSKLKTIKRLLDDAERRKLKDKTVGNWLEKLEDLAYEMDDVLDEWNTEMHKLKQRADDHEDLHSSSAQKKVCAFLLSICSCFKEVPLCCDLAGKIKELSRTLNHILKEANDFKFVGTDAINDPHEFKCHITTSVFDESEVKGREYDKNTIKKTLLSNCSSDGKEGVHIVSIVGTGGIGKTTLAQLVFDDGQVKRHFDPKIWVCVSAPFDQKRIAKAILEGLEVSSTNMNEMEKLFRSIRSSISGKKFLIVLDDLWTEAKTEWGPLWHSLKDGAPGSRILITTRSERVARVANTSYLHPLKQLHDLDCWLILRRIAFTGRSVDRRGEMEEIGRKIADKCRGVPLAARFLGCHLRLKDTVEEWQDVLDSEIWELDVAGVDLFPHLYLSYKELSPEMRLCFSYCAVFPKDSEINVERLITLWMAQGYLGRSRRGEHLEKMGRACFDNLVTLSLFQDLRKIVWKNRTVMVCKMHDIVHDFAQFLTKSECTIIEKLEGKMHNFSHDKTRHLTWLDQQQELSSLVCNNTKLRSFYGPITPSNLFTRLKRLRVLDIRDCGLQELPREIGYLIHLRFLDLSGNPLEELPATLCDLYNLETLCIEWCRELSLLPQQIGNLVNLRYLRNEEVGNLEIPEGFGKLTSLRELTEFQVGSGYTNLGCLKDLNCLQGYLWIVIDGEFNDEKDLLGFGKAELKNKSNLVSLALSFNSNAKIINNRGRYIETLEPPPKLRDLYLRRYPNTKLPSWIFTSLKHSLRNLTLSICKSTLLDDLEKLLSLEILEIEYNDAKIIGREFLGVTTIEDQTTDLDNETMDGTSNRCTSIRSPQPSAAAKVVAFPKLKKLTLGPMSHLRMWEDLTEEEDNVLIVVMPQLQQLILYRCPRLMGLPHRILRKASSLKRLTMIGCDTMEKRYKQETGEDWIHISHIPNVEIQDRFIGALARNPDKRHVIV